MYTLMDEYDIAVIGAGHAGAEAALTAAKMGMRAVLFTISMDTVANLPCNPSIGGTAKGHLVKEIDALGGAMGLITDKVFIHSRMLNRGKGPAVHSLRAQVDRAAYHLEMKYLLEREKNLTLKQAEITDIVIEDGKVTGVVTALSSFYKCKAAIICTGTFLAGQIFVGHNNYKGGPDNILPPEKLGVKLREYGVNLRRFKTGTPARVHKDSIDFSKIEVQPGDDPVVPMSFMTQERLYNRVDCHIAYTNENTHSIIRENITKAAMYSGDITGVGPRSCPSIEDKIVRFAGKNRHQIFVEPMGLNTKEMYLSGLSTSLPEDVQVKMYRSIKGFENIEIIRSAYAIEYDCIDPRCLNAALEFKNISGLYGAGQFNGTSGYEEAAAQGLAAAVNAVLKIRGEEPFILPRSSSYIGTLIDDLVTKGCDTPYRMMTSRSEYRLILRQDNADERLTPIGKQLGLVSKERWDKYLEKQESKNYYTKYLSKIVIPPGDKIKALLEEKNTAQIVSGAYFMDLLKRPELNFADLRRFLPADIEISAEVIEQIEINVKYEGYIAKQIKQAEEMKRLEEKIIPEDIDYNKIMGISHEGRDKLVNIMPRSIGQTMRISGVSPSDISVLLVYLKQHGR